MSDLSAQLEEKQSEEQAQLDVLNQLAADFIGLMAESMARQLPQMAMAVGLPQQEATRTLGESGMKTLRETVQGCQDQMQDRCDEGLNKAEVWPHLNPDNYYRRANDRRNEDRKTVPRQLTAIIEKAYPKDVEGVRGQFAWALADCLADFCNAVKDAGFQTTTQNEEGDPVIEHDLLYNVYTWPEEALTLYARYRDENLVLRERGIEVRELEEVIAAQDTVELWSIFND